MVEKFEAVPQTQPKKKNGFNKALTIILIVLIVLVLFTIVMRLFVITRVQVKQTSMANTYQEDEIIWVDKTKTLNRGDVVVFYENERPSNVFVELFNDNGYPKLIKRAIAVEGDKLWIEKIAGTDTYVIKIMYNEEVHDEQEYFRGKNAVVIPEQKINNNCSNEFKNSSSENPIVLGAGEFFAVGDNRNFSRDSRSSTLGKISYSKILGIAIS